jgi:polar amino acid transport system substrate-binding protein
MQAARRITTLAVLLLLLSACRPAEGDTWPRIQESGVLRVGIDPTFPPFALADGEKIWGLDADLARALAAELGLEARFTYFGYDGLYDALTTAQVDVLISALVIAPERTEDVAYSAPYMDAGIYLFVPDGSDVNEIKDLAGRTVAVELGAPGHEAALAWQRRLRGLTVQTHDSVGAALEAVADGRAAAALADQVGGRLYLAQRDTARPALLRLSQPVVAEPYALAVRIADEQLLTALDDALERLSDAGTIDEIEQRWLGKEETGRLID